MSLPTRLAAILSGPGGEGSKRAGKSLAALVFLALLSLSGAQPAQAQCTLGGTLTTWTDGNSNWLNATNWNSGVPNSGTNACITDGSSTVTLDSSQVMSVDSLQIGSGNTLTSGSNLDFFVFGTQIINNGQFVLNGGGGANDILGLENNVTLSGTGTLTLTVAGGGGTSIIQQQVGSLTLTNQSTIQGAGIIGNGGLALNNSGTINANSSGQALLVNGSGGTTNSGLMEASGGGVLQLQGITINNAGGNVTANAGSTVQLFGNTTIQGGTLTNNGGGAFLGTPASNVAILDGSTGSGAITINGTYTSDFNSDTYVLGTINNKGNFQLNGGSGTNGILLIDSANVTLQGGGTLTLSTSTGGGFAIVEQAIGGTTLTNVDNTIQGSGIIGNGGLALVNQATINANSTGGGLTTTLLLNGSGGITNTGLMEATNSGVLQLDGVTVNNAGGNITAVGAGATVQLFGNAVIQGGTLNNNGGAFFGTPAGNVAFLDGSTGAGAITINGTYTSDFGSDTYVLGTINNNGNIQVNGGAGTNGFLLTDSTNVTLQGGGTLTLSTVTGGGVAIIEQAVGGTTLTNVNDTIQGEGIIGNGGLTLVNEATIDANSTGGPLTTTLLLNGSGGITNTGLMEATNSGVLQIDGTTVNNAGGNITAVGASATVQIFGSAVIQGGTLNNTGGGLLGTPASNVAILDGSTGAGAITINGTYTSDFGSDTYVLGTINNNNNFQVNGGAGTNGFLLTDSTNVTLQGGGTLTLNTLTGGGNAYIEQAVGGTTLTNVNNTIQGEGVIGNNGLTLVNEATIDANSTGGSLITTLTLQGGAVTNQGLMEATNSGVLQINGDTVNNAGGNITANGAGATVQFFGSAMIQGGTLNNNGGAFFGTPAGNVAFLDGSTGAGAITINGTYTSDFGSDTYVLGTINNNNNFQVNGGAGTNGFLLTDSTNVTLQGGGTLTLNTLTGGGNAYIEQAAGGLTLTNVDNTIQGSGIIGNNGLTLVNESGGTINANSTGGSLITTLTLQGGAVTNQGLMEATNNGVLQINGDVVNNAGGNITANGAGATVQFFGSAMIQGGTLNNNGGAFFGTPAGNVAYLDGSTGSGAVTINGTYTSDLGSETFLLGTINNNNNFQLNGGAGTNSFLFIDNNVTLQGGGTVTLSTAGGGGNAYIEQAVGGLTLENVNNTIQGGGIIGNNGLSVLNDAGGTLLANAPFQSLFINGGGIVTNNGTFQANVASALVVQNVTFTNFAGNTLTGGTYNVFGSTFFSGTLEIDPLGNTGGEIVNNAATILLDGPNSNFVDAASLDALSNFSNNTAAGSFTIQNGRNLTTPGDFSNAGKVTVGNSSTLTIGSGANTYTQSAGTTQGIGTIAGNVSINGGTIIAGTPGAPGTLNINGNYTQTGTGIFSELISNSANGLLNISGAAALGSGGALNITLLGGFNPAAGTSYTILDYGTQSGTFTISDPLFNGGTEKWVISSYSGGDGDDIVLTAEAVGAGHVTATWNTASGNWTTATQWACAPGPANCVPNNSGTNDYDAVLTSAGNTLTLDSTSNPTGITIDNLTLTAGTLNIADGASLTVNQTTTNDGLITLTGASSTLNAGALTNNGTITLSGTGDSLHADLTNAGAINLSGNNDMLTDSGDFNNNSGGSLNVNANLNSVTVAGNFNNNTGAALTMSGTNGSAAVAGAFNNAGGTVTLNGTNNSLSAASFSNSGTVGVGTGGAVTISGNYTQSGAGSSTQLDGTLTAGTVVSIAGGSLLGNGTINGNVIFTGGAIQPGSLTAPGILTINGDFSHSAAAFNELISSTSNGLLNVSGNVFLGPGSSLNIKLLGGFDPGNGTSFMIMDYGSESGTFLISDPLFNGGTQQWVISSYTGGDGDDIVLTAEAAGTVPTPEPGTMLLLGIGLLGLGGYAGKKKSAGAQ